MIEIGKIERTSIKVASGRAKVVRNKRASLAEKTVTASVLIPKGSNYQMIAKVVVTAPNVLRDPKASSEADKIATSALTQKIKNR